MADVTLNVLKQEATEFQIAVKGVYLLLSYCVSFIYFLNGKKITVIIKTLKSEQLKKIVNFLNVIKL